MVPDFVFCCAVSKGQSALPTGGSKGQSALPTCYWAKRMSWLEGSLACTFWRTPEPER